MLILHTNIARFFEFYKLVLDFKNQISIKYDYVLKWCEHFICKVLS